MESSLPPRLNEIVSDFEFCEGREKIELLIEFAESLPDLPDELASNRDQMEQVHECMTPVFIHAFKENGKMIFHIDVPQESPTVRGYASLIKQGLDGCTPEEVLKVPNDFYQEMGLQEVLTHQRLNGLSALLAHIKQLAVDGIEE